MRYKAGDRVKIRTWQDMYEEYGLDKQGNINQISKYNIQYTVGVEKYINHCRHKRIITIIEERSNESYSADLLNYCWTDEMIEGIVDKNDEVIRPITSRFDILDIR